MKSRTRHVLLAAACALFLSSTASATVMVEVPLEDMIRSADAIVYGTVERTGVRMSIGERGMEPQTLTTVRVHEWLAGEGGETVRIRELGGQWQGGGLHYEGTPTYEVGERVVVFLERRDEAPHDLRTFAMVQGKFVIRPGVPGTPDRVQRDLEGVAFARWADGRQTVSPPGREPAMSLDAFLDFVRRVRGGER
ncbi:MAG TPA: hypothetical protein RMH99_28525 [Sandaracinaceae bacterium LLY-WYZ-13_1]|nr:hypothetical protein [Sandaracinaceae bacterium LLY-WYZ-13_1]